MGPFVKFSTELLIETRLVSEICESEVQCGQGVIGVQGNSRGENSVVSMEEQKRLGFNGVEL